MTRTTALPSLLIGLGILSTALPAASAPATVDDMIDLSLEDLMEVVVTSVTRKRQTLAETAAAVHVIQADEIRRSGATNIPEALRLAPGVQVSAIGNNKWAVSIRGQADRFSNKLLVLVDGRSVYTPLFSGVFWEGLDVPLENVERIEVIRGPGASAWGANAVNGVINIITRSPFDTQGGLVDLAAGDELRHAAFARYGWRPGPDTAVQVYAKTDDYGSSQPALGGGGGADDANNDSAGFRLQHVLARGTLHFQGAAVRSRAGDELLLLSATEPPPGRARPRLPRGFVSTDATQRIDAGHLMLRWEDLDEAGYGQSVQLYLEQSEYDHVVLGEQRDTQDLEYQNRRRLGNRHDLIWGLGYRRSADRIDSSPMFWVDDRHRDTDLYTVFVEDEITLVPDRWRLSVGARLEHNDYTHYEPQPNLRLMWTPDDSNSVWLSLAQAVRTPARIERGGSAYLLQEPPGALPITDPVIVQLTSEQLGSERLQGIDAGWRHRFSATASLDLALFDYDYDHLRGSALAGVQVLPSGSLQFDLAGNNHNSAHTRGAELSLEWQPLANWRLQGSYAWLDDDIRVGSQPGQAPSDYTGTSPENQYSLRSSLELTPRLHWDAWLRRTSHIERYDISAYSTLDTRLAWQCWPEVELSLVGQNLLDSAHAEYGSQWVLSSVNEIQRGYYLNAEWKF